MLQAFRKWIFFVRRTSSSAQRSYRLIGRGHRMAGGPPPEMGSVKSGGGGGGGVVNPVQYTGIEPSTITAPVAKDKDCPKTMNAPVLARSGKPVAALSISVALVKSAKASEVMAALICAAPPNGGPSAHQLAYSCPPFAWKIGNQPA